MTFPSKATSVKQCTYTVTQKDKIKHIINSVTEEMLKLKNSLTGYEPFSNNVTPLDCVDRLIAHRIVKKFYDPKKDKENAIARREACMESYLSYDRTFDNFEVNLWDDLHLRQAKVLLARWMRNFQIKNLDYVHTPGETYISSKGEVSIYAKLAIKSHWTTTYNCVEDTCEFVYRNRAFKKFARQHIGHISREEKRKLYFRFRHSPDIGYSIFSWLLKDRVLTIVDGSRLTSVPKNTDEDRTINVEALFPIILQRAVAQEFLKRFKRRGNDLGNFIIHDSTDLLGINKIEHSAQYLHGLMIKDNKFATIDFSNASNSVMHKAIAALFPKQVSDLLFKYRSSYVDIGNELYEPNMLSSMGNGFTFEVMTMLLYAVASTYSPFVRVYGDDVIIPNDKAEYFLKSVSLLGFSPNMKKTFVNSFFRESCGYFYSDDHGYIVSFDFGPIESFQDVIITTNKLTILLEQNQASPELLDKLRQARDRINVLVHASRKGPLPPTLKLQHKFMCQYIFDVDCVKKHKRSKELRLLRKHFIVKNSVFVKNCQLEADDLQLVYFSYYVPQKSVLFNKKYEQSEAALLISLYAGRRITPTIRNKGKWVDLPGFIDSCGRVFLISNILNQKFKLRENEKTPRAV